jgi:Skp family chaperone for outer membrane proteins
VIKQKILEFALKNWKEILIIFSLSLVVLKTHMDYRALNKAYEASKQEMQLQFNSLRDIHAEEIKQREEALQTYRDTIDSLQEDYTIAQEELKEEKQKRTRDYTRKYSQDKEGLANEIINAYGFELVE